MTPQNKGQTTVLKIRVFTGSCTGSTQLQGQGLPKTASTAAWDYRTLFPSHPLPPFGQQMLHLQSPQPCCCHGAGSSVLLLQGPPKPAGNSFVFSNFFIKLKPLFF